jgi:signal recognition particle GTPase
MKTNNSNNLKNILIANIVIILLFSAGNIFSQANQSNKLDESEIKNLASKLEKKVLLSESQTKSVENILNNYASELAKFESGNSKSEFSSKQQLVESFNSKLVSLLDEKQKMKFDIIKEGWWGSVFSEEKD